MGYSIQNLRIDKKYRLTLIISKLWRKYSEVERGIISGAY